MRSLLWRRTLCIFSFFYMFNNTLRETNFHLFILLISHFILPRIVTKTQYFLTTALYQEYSVSGAGCHLYML